MVEFHLTFQRFRKNVDDGNLTFSIENIKSRVPSVGYFVFHCYNINEEEILVESEPVHIGERFVILPSYHSYVENFEIDEDVLHQSFTFEIELVLLGITSENPCWFNHIMLEMGNHDSYHKPAESLEKADIVFNNNNYAVLFDANSDNSLQVIRPYHDKFNTKTITASRYTILAPHLIGEPKTDTPSNIMQEFINQTEQYIQIKR